LQAGDAVKVAGVPGPDGVSKLQRTGSDHEISQRKIDAFGCLFSADASTNFSRRFRQRIDRNRGFQIVQEHPATLADFRRVGSIDAVANLCDRDSGQDDQHFAEGLMYVFDSSGRR